MEQTRWPNIDEETPVTEGIFEVRREKVDYWDRTLHTTEGIIRGIEEKEVEYPSPTSFRKGEKKDGVHITLENALGTAQVEFPRRLGFAEKVLLGQKVRYSKFHELYDDGGALYRNKYNLSILTGPLAGEEIEEEILS